MSQSRKSMPQTNTHVPKIFMNNINEHRQQSSMALMQNRNMIINDSGAPSSQFSPPKPVLNQEEMNI